MDLEIYLKTNLRLKVHLQDMLAAAVSLRSSDSLSTVGCFEKLNSSARPPANRTYTLFLYFYKNLTASIFCPIRGKKETMEKEILTTSTSCSMSKERRKRRKKFSPQGACVRWGPSWSPRARCAPSRSSFSGCPRGAAWPGTKTNLKKEKRKEKVTSMAVATLASCCTAPYCSEEEATLPVDWERTAT